MNIIIHINVEEVTMNKKKSKKSFLSFFVNTFAFIGIGFSLKVGYEVSKEKTLTEPEPLTYVTKAIKVTTDQAVQTADYALQSFTQFSEKYKMDQTDYAQNNEVTPLDETDEFETSLVTLHTVVNKALKYIQKEDSLESYSANRLIAEFKSLHTQIEHIIKYYKHNPFVENSFNGLAGDSSIIIHKRNLERKRLGLVNKVESSLKKLVNAINGEKEEILVAHTAEDGIKHAHELLSMLVQ